MREVGKVACSVKRTSVTCISGLLFAGMAFKIPHLNCSFSAGYFEGTPSFRWGELEHNEEIGKGSFGSVVKAKYVPENRMVVVKRFFGETEGKFQERGKGSENA